MSIFKSQYIRTATNSSSSPGRTSPSRFRLYALVFPQPCKSSCDDGSQFQMFFIAKVFGSSLHFQSRKLTRQHVILSVGASDWRFQINWGKSSRTPTQLKTFLGMEILFPLLKVFPTSTWLENLSPFKVFPQQQLITSKRLRSHLSSFTFNNTMKDEEPSTLAFSDVVKEQHVYPLGQ